MRLSSQNTDGGRPYGGLSVRNICSHWSRRPDLVKILCHNIVVLQRLPGVCSLHLCRGIELVEDFRLESTKSTETYGVPGARTRA